MSTWRLGIFVWMAVCGATVAVAQPAGVNSELERTANTTPEEKLAYSEEAKAEIAGIVAEMEKLFEAIKRTGDADDIQCVGARLTSVLAIQQVVLEAHDAMQQAIAAGEKEKADQQFRRIAVGLNKSRVLLAEAKRCGSDQVGADGDTLLDVVDEGDGITLPTDDPLGILGTDLPLDPPELSPFGQ